MILLDVNVLVYAARREFAEHELAARWLTQALVGAEPVAVLDEVLAAATRLLTNHLVLRAPSTIDEALDFCGRVRDAPAAVVPLPSTRRWDRFTELAILLGLRGNDVLDALLAATALDLGATVATFDRGFRRFPGVSVRRPEPD